MNLNLNLNINNPETEVKMAEGGLEGRPLSVPVLPPERLLLLPNQSLLAMLCKAAYTLAKPP